MGLKAIAIYRDGSKAQPVVTKKADDEKAEKPVVDPTSPCGGCPMSASH